MKTWMLAALLALPATAQAHEVWIERDGDGPARIYLGEPAEAPPAGGDPEFVKLKAPHLLTPATGASQRRTGFIEVAVAPGDVRAWDDNVFAPWGEAGSREGVVYYARAGRSEATARLPFEIAPVTAGGNRFAVTRDGKPMAATEVTIVAPDRSTSKQTTDAAGMLDLGIAAKGRYLLVAAAKDSGKQTLPGGAVDTVHRITTTSFVVG